MQRCRRQKKEDPLDFKDGYSINLAQAEDWDIYVTGEMEAVIRPVSRNTAWSWTKITS